MTDEHHDAELCKRLAEKFWEIKIFAADELGEVPYVYFSEIDVILLADWDPCCNPAHSWMLEQRLEIIGWLIAMDNSDAIGKEQPEYEVEMWGKPNGVAIRGVTRLHALALGADAVTK